MMKTVAGPRLLSERFENDLLHGMLKPLLDLVKRDRDLIAEIRNDRLDVYCKGNRLLGLSALSQGYRGEVHDKFGAPGHFTDAEKVATFCEKDVPLIKHRIATHAATGKEIEFEQMIVRANNLEQLATDYIIVDRQSLVELDGDLDKQRGRIDLLGVYWPGASRNCLAHLAPALIEVKWGLHGGVDKIAEQIGDYHAALSGSMPRFSGALQALLRQKVRLGLFSGLSSKAQEKIATLPVSSDLAHLHVVFALVDYNPRSMMLGRNSFDRKNFPGDVVLLHLGFGMWKANSVPLDAT